jgi:two-component system chemotaxis response regulator CheB
VKARRIAVLVVESPTVLRPLLVRMIESDPALCLAGIVDTGPEALAFVQRSAPDVVLMGIHLEGMDGFEVSRRIMETQPLPIVLCSMGTDSAESATASRALGAGAVAHVAGPFARDGAESDRLLAQLLQTLRLMSEVKVVRRWPARLGGTAAVPRTQPRPSNADAMIAVGASTGGPQALQTILAGLPKDFPIPILVAQHIAAGFLPGLAQWLSQTTALKIEIGSHGSLPADGHVYLAPDDCHMGLDARGRIRLEKSPPENGVRPAVEYLFRSVAAHCGAEAVGVLLTGMGQDGAVALKAMRERGARTIAQDRGTSAVYGMPAAAVALDAVDEVLPIEQIGAALQRIASQYRNRKAKW